MNARITDTTSRTASIARSNADRQGQTALFSVVGRGWVRVAKVLLDSGARVDAKDGTGKTVLDTLEAAPGAAAGAPAGRPENPAREEMRKLIRSAAGLI